MADNKARYAVHVLSSSSESDDANVNCSNKKPVNTQENASPVIIDLSDDDDYLFLPLAERISARSKGSQNKNTKSSNSKPGVEDQCVSSAASSAPYTSTQTASFPKKVIDSDVESLPDLPNNDDQYSAPSSAYFCTQNDVDHVSCDIVKSPRKAKRNREEILDEQQSKFKAREEKRHAHELLLLAKEKQKMLKNIRKIEIKSLKPDECIKSITVEIDMRLLELTECVGITQVLEESAMQFTVVDQFIQNSITWSRKVVKSTLEDDLKISQEYNDQEEDQILIVLTVSEFLRAVKRFNSDEKKPSDLIELVHQIKELHPNKRITLVTCGLDKHFSAQQSRAQSQYRQHILQNDDQTKCKRGKRKADNSDANISHSDVEEALVDLQIRVPCSVYMLSDPVELARLVASITKAVAQSPFKQDRMGSDVTWASNVETKDSVKVDKDGNGLKLLWQRQLQQLYLVTSDVAQAIMSHYPTPTALFSAYRKCSDIQQRQKLLQDIMVRRGVGPLSTNRRIGPELSRKLHILFTSTNSNEMLDSYQC